MRMLAIMPALCQKGNERALRAHDFHDGPGGQLRVRPSGELAADVTLDGNLQFGAAVSKLHRHSAQRVATAQLAGHAVSIRHLHAERHVLSGKVVVEVCQPGGYGEGDFDGVLREPPHCGYGQLVERCPAPGCGIGGNAHQSTLK